MQCWLGQCVCVLGAQHLVQHARVMLADDAHDEAVAAVSSAEQALHAYLEDVREIVLCCLRDAHRHVRARAVHMSDRDPRVWRRGAE